RIVEESKKDEKLIKDHSRKHSISPEWNEKQTTKNYTDWTKGSVSLSVPIKKPTSGQENENLKPTRRFSRLDQTLLTKPKVDKKNLSDEIKGVLKYCLAQMQGMRREMEDAHSVLLKFDNAHWSKWSYFSIFDGHNGKQAAKFVAKNLHVHIMEQLNSMVKVDLGLDSSSIKPVKSSELDIENFLTVIKQAYKDTDDALRKVIKDESGCVAVSCLIGTEKIYFMNVGDSRAILVSPDGKVVMETDDHKPDDPGEIERLQNVAESGVITQQDGDIKRVRGLAMTRVFGDFQIAKNIKEIVPADPEIIEFTRSKKSPVAFIVLACDGIWDVITNEELALIILDRMNVTDNLCEITNYILDTCLIRGSTDNMSLFLIKFPQGPSATDNYIELDKRIREYIQHTLAEKNENTNVEDIWRKLMKKFETKLLTRKELELLDNGGGIQAKRHLFVKAVTESL
ncbi:unnamed protein product, partial [Didymodactylos carnosus]